VLWLGDKRGNLADWFTQRWVCATGRRIRLADHPWLDGPVGGTRGIGRSFFEEFAAEKDYELVRSGVLGLIPSFRILEQNNPSLSRVAAPVRLFYEQTSQFDLDVWSEWKSIFRPFGSALSLIFSKRLQQLNVPLSPLDSAKGMTSSVTQLRNPSTGAAVCTAWVRELQATGNVVYAGGYAVAEVPGHPSPCVRVDFPLPNGSAIVLMKAEVNPDNSLSLKSNGKRFGDPGFYFVVHDGNSAAWARYVASMKEEIRVYAAEEDAVRADHFLRIWGIQFLRLHYRMRRRANS
jgi:hypothetical protein